MNVAKMFTLLAGSVGARIGGALIGLTTQIVVARLLDPSDVGILFLAMSMAALLSLVVISGYPTLALTQLPRLTYLNQPRIVTAFHASALWDWIVISLVLAVLAAFILAFVPLANGMQLALIFGVLSTPGSALIRYSSAIANSLKYFAVTFIPDNILRPGAFLVFVVASFGLGFRPSILVLLWAYILSNALAAFVQLFFLRGNHLRLSHLKSWRKSLSHVLRARSMAIALVAAVATSFADIITLLGGFFLKAEDVALIGVTVRLAAIAGFVIQSAQQFVLPDLTVAITSRADTAAHGILYKLNMLTLAIIVTGLAFTVLFGGFVLQIFGPTYAAGYELLVLLMVGQSVRALSGLNQSLLSIAGFQLRTAGSCVIAVIVLVSLWLLLQPPFGLRGIGLAVIATEVVWGVLLAAQAGRLVGSRGDLIWLLTNRK